MAAETTDHQALLNDARRRMGLGVKALEQNLSQIRSGRANTALVEHLPVEYYGASTPLNQVAAISVEDARTLSIQPWDRSMIPVIEKAIHSSDLGLSPAAVADRLRLQLPPLTEERRREFIRQARQETESARVAVRNIRRALIADLKKLARGKSIDEDTERSAQEETQKWTDSSIASIDKILADKEVELLEF